MFEIRVICDLTDTDRVTTALSSTFATGAIRQYPTRDGQRTRLYATADHRPEPGPWPTPRQAYADAPSIDQEIGWAVRTTAEAECFTELDRAYYLRKAALLDRIALLDEPDEPRDATETAEAAAVMLLDTDKSAGGRYHGRGYWPEHPAAEANPRGYVRQEYAQWWAKEGRAQHRAALLAAGCCPNCAWPQHQCTCADHPDA
ncbi:hypothetical protein [Streptomyces silvisoli]|uniref:Uncharacterized protein n=1 Tax=Streptomyces silvisoli TaxID=3034235 RepID=A0ABT5ZF94_9ACTN|nr:hypothetical protein [Streptomyces silvisoli]MDF3288492.1 hypothetical protein [Streptomyces silvisoli]